VLPALQLKHGPGQGNHWIAFDHESTKERLTNPWPARKKSPSRVFDHGRGILVQFAFPAPRLARLLMVHRRLPTAPPGLPLTIISGAMELLSAEARSRES
jgi:hypothetical protein